MRRPKNYASEFIDVVNTLSPMEGLLGEMNIPEFAKVRIQEIHEAVKKYKNPDYGAEIVDYLKELNQLAGEEFERVATEKVAVYFAKKLRQYV